MPGSREVAALVTGGYCRLCAGYNLTQSTSNGGIGAAVEEPRVTHEELVLMSALAKLNQRIAQFVMGVLDAETGTPQYALSPEDEQALGAEMIELGSRVEDRGRGRGVVVQAFQYE